MSATAAHPRIGAGESGAPVRAIAASTTTHRRTTWFLSGFALVYAFAFTATAVVCYTHYLEHRLDLGNMVQTVWSTAHGHFLQMSDARGVEVSRLGSHFDPFLVLLVPLWWVWSSPYVLLAAQAFAVASGAFPVYWLARKHISNNNLSVVFAIAYLVYSPTQWNAFAPAGVHAVTFAIPLLLYAIWFLDNDRLVPFAACAIIAGTTKEEIAAAVGGLGLWYAVRRGKRWVGGGIFVAGVTWACVNILVVIPHYAPDGQLPFAGRYSDVGSTPTGMLRVAVTDPSAFIHATVTWHKVGFLALVFLPFLCLWALEPLMLIGALPDLVINLLSSKPEQTTIYYHYTSGIIPFVVAASVLGAARLRRGRLVGTLLIGVMMCLAIVSPITWTIERLHDTPRSRVTAINTALELIPDRVPVSASQTVGAYVSTRSRVALFPVIGRSDWIIVGPVSGSDDAKVYDSRVQGLKASPFWRTVYDSSGVAVFERRTHLNAS
jgi:uncharacterized membrane protein